MEETISLQDIFTILRKKIGLIIFCTIIGVSIAGAATFFLITPKYGSQAQLMVRLPQDGSNNVNDINANLQMINTYKDLIKSDKVMDEVQLRLKDQYNGGLSTASIKNSISVNQSQNSQMFTISAVTEDPLLSEKIVNETGAVFQEVAAETLSVDKITIVSNAVANMNPVSPNNKLNLAIGLVGGVLAGVALAFILSLFDRTVKDEHFVSDELELPVLGIIPSMTAKELQVKINRVVPEYSGEAMPEAEQVQQKGSNVPSRRNRTRV